MYTVISTIEKRTQLNEIFSELGMLEVYATMDYTDESKFCDIVGIVRKSIDIYKVWNALVPWFPNGVSFIPIHNYKDPILRGHKLIWKGGRWYV